MNAHVRGWWHRNTVFHDENVMDRTTCGGGCVTVWGCFSFNQPFASVIITSGLINHRVNLINSHIVNELHSNCISSFLFLIKALLFIIDFVNILFSNS